MPCSGSVVLEKTLNECHLLQYDSSVHGEIPQTHSGFNLIICFVFDLWQENKFICCAGLLYTWYNLGCINCSLKLIAPFM